MNVAAPIKERNVLLPHVSWQTYEQILRESGDTNAHRFYYDRGRLEIVMPSQLHEEIKCALHSLVERIAGTWKWQYRNLGSTTFKNEALTRGFEPDVCFYVQRYAEIAEKDTLVFPGDPAPDLVVEIDITSPSLERLPLYGKFGVREVWRANAEGVVFIHRFDADGEATSEIESTTLPGLTATQIAAFLRDRQLLAPWEWEDAVREWARVNAPA